MEAQYATVFVCGFLLLVLPVVDVSAQTEDVEVKPQNAEAPATPVKQPSANDERLLQYILSEDYRPIKSILLDQEAPLLGLHWGGLLLYDIPLNGQPADASTTLRQAKLSYRKSLTENWTLRFQVNYSNDHNFELGNNYAVYTGWKNQTGTIGVFDPPFSLEKVSKRAGSTFMERALVVEALSERRGGGVGWLRRTPDAIMNAGLFFTNPDYQGQSQSGQALVLHYVHSPLAQRKPGAVFGGRDIWIGGSLSYRRGAEGPSTEFRSRPEVGTVDYFTVDTGAIAGARDIIRLGLEASKVSGPLSWQMELIGAQVSREKPGTLNFWGGYVFASWFLTGESRSYDPLSGRFLTVTPLNKFGKDGWGAFELAARASYVDLNDRLVFGGEQSNLTLGLNWYLSAQWRVMTNLVKVVNIERPGSEFDGADPLIFSLRLQWYIQ